MRQTWHDLCFMHWREDPAILQALIPSGLEIDLYNGEAWIGVVPFWMSGITFKSGVPALGMTAFPELNVRTYVRHKGKSGVWFFSLDAESRVAVRGARFRFHLPYFDAEMSIQQVGAVHRYRSHRSHRGAPSADFEANYRPVGEVFQAKAGSLEDFLTSRYCLFSADARGRLSVGEIDHDPWPLQVGSAAIDRNDMAKWLGIDLPRQPEHVLFSKKIDVRVWSLSECNANVP